MLHVTRNVYHYCSGQWGRWSLNIFAYHYMLVRQQIVQVMNRIRHKLQTLFYSLFRFRCQKKKEEKENNKETHASKLCLEALRQKVWRWRITGFDYAVKWLHRFVAFLTGKRFDNNRSELDYRSDVVTIVIKSVYGWISNCWVHLSWNHAVM